jgi:hypothetical protein
MHAHVYKDTKPDHVYVNVRGKLVLQKKNLEKQVCEDASNSLAQVCMKEKLSSQKENQPEKAEM